VLSVPTANKYVLQWWQHPRRSNNRAQAMHDEQSSGFSELKTMLNISQLSFFLLFAKGQPEHNHQPDAKVL
jgi:hypothetical protein